mgnify:CR=1 FL=1
MHFSFMNVEQWQICGGFCWEQICCSFLSACSGSGGLYHHEFYTGILMFYFWCSVALRIFSFFILHLQPRPNMDLISRNTLDYWRRSWAMTSKCIDLFVLTEVIVQLFHMDVNEGWHSMVTTPHIHPICWIGSVRRTNTSTREVPFRIRGVRGPKKLEEFVLGCYSVRLSLT